MKITAIIIRIVMGIFTVGAILASAAIMVVVINTATPLASMIVFGLLITGAFSTWVLKQWLCNRKINRSYHKIMNRSLQLN